jgi:hypothetical protein
MNIWLHASFCEKVRRKTVVKVDMAVQLSVARVECTFRFVTYVAAVLWWTSIITVDEVLQEMRASKH